VLGNVRLARDKHSSLFSRCVSDAGNKPLITLTQDRSIPEMETDAFGRLRLGERQRRRPGQQQRRQRLEPDGQGFDVALHRGIWQQRRHFGQRRRQENVAHRDVAVAADQRRRRQPRRRH